MISLREVKDRKLVHWAVAYLAGAWAVLEAADLVGGHFGWPDPWLRGLMIVLGVGFLATLVLAWYHGEQGRQQAGVVEVGILTALLALAAVGVSWVNGSAGASAEGTDALAPDSAELPHPAAAEQGSIAVLPFTDLSPEGDQGYFSDGITEELLNVLAQLPELRVASRTSAFSFKGANASVDSIARALNVRHVLEGSVRKADDQVRITAQLIDASTGYHLWSETYDRELRDIFAVQDEISRAIVDQLEVRLSGRDGPLARAETEDPEAHVLLLRAVRLIDQTTTEALARAESLLEEALDGDPEYARAWAELARVHEAQVYYGQAPRERGVERARAEAHRALELDSTNARAHGVLGLIASDYDWDWTASEEHYARLLHHHPGYGPAYTWRGGLLARLKRAEEAQASVLRAVELDPVSAHALTNAGHVLAQVGRQAEAVELTERAVELVPDSPVPLSNLALFYALMGRHDEATRAGTRAVEEAPDYSSGLAALGYAYARAGEAGEAERMLERMRARPETSPYALATVHAGLGHRARTLELLEEAVERRDPLAPDLGTDPVFGEYRDDPRVERLLEEMGLGG